MKNKDAIKWFTMLKEKFVNTEYEGYLDSAIPALEKQEVNITNAEKFKRIFGIYATEVWAMPENDFLKWLNKKDGEDND